MKADIKMRNSDTDIMLSIGMIVKNEEKVLRRCLESLRPLMNSVKSELIIVDTGSEDLTVSIAREYTDNVIFFKWINDFSAARNVSIEKAKGKWYLFIDADEYFDEDIDSLISFFRIPELYDEYKTIEITLRSYTDREKKKYSDISLPRFHRLDEAIKFIGSVHETLPARKPIGSLSTVLHHTGYCYITDSQEIAKHNRNVPLMIEEYKKNPNDLRIICHLIDGLTYEKERCEKFINRALELLRNNSDTSREKNIYRNIAYMQIADFYKVTKPEFAAEICEEYFDTLIDADKYVATIAIVKIKADIMMTLSRYEKALEEYNRYFFLYNNYKEDKMDVSDLSAHVIFGISETEYAEKVYCAAECLQKLKKYDEAFILIEQYNTLNLDDDQLKIHLATIKSICKAKNDFSKMASQYEMISSFESNYKKSLILKMLESTYYEFITSEERKKYAEDLIRSGTKGNYIELMKLTVSDEDDTFIDDIIDLFSKIDNWSDGYSELIYLAVKYKIDISEKVTEMNASDFRTNFEMIACSHDDFAQYVYEYGLPETYTSGIKQFAWLTAMYEKAVYRSFELADDLKLELYHRFSVLLGDYVNNIYNPELLNDSDIEVLPSLHKFGFYMSKAMNAYSTGDMTGYVHEMRYALRNCESMKMMISFMLDQLKKNL